MTLTRWTALGLCLLGSTVAGACGDDGGTAMDSATGGSSSEGSSSGAATTEGGTTTGDPSAGTQGVTSSDPSASTTDDGGSSGGDDTGPPPVIDFAGLCFEAAPDGADQAAPIPDYSGGDCPALTAGFNTFASVGGDRTVLIVEPTDLQPDEVLPVVFLWHWLGGDAQGFLERGEVQDAVDQYRILAIIPEEKGDLLFRWPFSSIDSDARMQEEFAFFDDALACAADNYPIEANCVSSIGVSAGALWTAQLAGGRGEHLSSIVSLSGGTGGLVKDWTTSMHKMPAFVLWGGPMDVFPPLNFQETSADLQANLVAEGHSTLECIHNCGHDAPPFDVPEGVTTFAPMWEYVLDHPFWLDDGDSPWDAGLPESVPPWCRMGVGTATIRDGECGDSPLG